MAYLFPKILISYDKLDKNKLKQLIQCNSLINQYIRNIHSEILKLLPHSYVVIGGSYALGTHCWTLSPNLKLLSDVDLYVFSDETIEATVKEQLSITNLHLWRKLRRKFLLSSSSFSKIKYLYPETISTYIEYQGVEKAAFDIGVVLDKLGFFKRTSLVYRHINETMTEMNTSYLMYKVVFNNEKKFICDSDIYEFGKCLWRLSHLCEYGAHYGLIIDIDKLNIIIHNVIITKSSNIKNDPNLKTWLKAAKIHFKSDFNIGNKEKIYLDFRNEVLDKWPESFLSYNLSNFKMA